MIVREFLEDSCLIFLGLVPNSNYQIPLALLYWFFLTLPASTSQIKNLISVIKYVIKLWIKKKMLLLLFLIELDFCHLFAAVIESMNK